MTEVTYEEYGDTKTEDLDQYGDIIFKKMQVDISNATKEDINKLKDYLDDEGWEWNCE